MIFYILIQPYFEGSKYDAVSMVNQKETLVPESEEIQISEKAYDHIMEGMANNKQVLVLKERTKDILNVEDFLITERSVIVEETKIPMVSYKERNGRYYLTSAFMITNINDYDPNKHIKISESVFMFLQQYQKEMGSLLVSIIEKQSEILDPDTIEILSTPTEAEQLRNHIQQIIHSAYSRIYVKIDLNNTYLYYPLVTCNNKLLSKGFVFTDENQTEEFEKIVKTGDLALIETAKEYLNASASLSASYAYIKKHQKLKGDLEKCLTIEEANVIYKDWINSLEI